MKKYILTLPLLFVSIITMAQAVSTPLKPGRTPEGVVYFLPKTVFQLNLLVEKKTYMPGEFCKYAEKFLRLSGIAQEEEVTHSIVSYGLTPVGVRDTSKCYTVMLKGKSATAEVKLSDDGVLQAVNAEPAKVKVKEPFKPAPRKAPVDSKQYLSAEVLSAGSVAKMAELTVQQILEIQNHRQMLISGEAEDMPTDKDQLQLMIDQLDKEREALMSMFLGTTTRDTVEQVITICPEKEVKREVVFRLNKKIGLVDKDDLSGIPYYMNIEDEHHTTLQKYDIPENKKDGGFFVNVPGRIKFTLLREDHQLASFNLYAAQFGFVELRSGSLFKRYVTHMTLNPVTGSVETIHADMPTK